MASLPNFAFIDASNLYLGIKDLGWLLNYKKFRDYLKENFDCEKAYLFIGYVATNEDLYKSLQEDGYILMFKPTIQNQEGSQKGNVDADLVLQALIDFPKYKKAVIVAGDGDYYSLVRYLSNKKKLLRVLAPNREMSSYLLRKEAKEKIIFLEDFKEKLEYKRKNTP